MLRRVSKEEKERRKKIKAEEMSAPHKKEMLGDLKDEEKDINILEVTRPKDEPLLRAEENPARRPADPVAAGVARTDLGDDGLPDVGVLSVGKSGSAGGRTFSGSLVGAEAEVVPAGAITVPWYERHVGAGRRWGIGDSVGEVLAPLQGEARLAGQGSAEGG